MTRLRRCLLLEHVTVLFRPSDPDVDDVEVPGCDLVHGRLDPLVRLLENLVDNFAGEGFVPIVDGAITRRSWLRDRLTRIQTRPALLLVLAPSDDTSRSRDASRSGVTFYEEYPDFPNSLDAEFGGIGLWVDSGSLNLADTVNVILDNLDAARFHEG